VLGEMPKNQVGWIVSAFLALSLAAWLSSAGGEGPAHGLREGWRRFVWLPATVLPLVLLAIAIWSRIDAYGVSMDRYAVAAGGAFGAACLAIAAAARRLPRIHEVMLVGVLFAAVAAVGTFGAKSVAAGSQAARLRGMLEAEGLLVGGRIEAPLGQDRLVRARKGEVASMLAELSRADALGRLAAFAPASRTGKLADAQSFFGAWPWARAAPATFVVNGGPGTASVGGGRLSGPFILRSAVKGGVETVVGAGDGRLTLSLEGLEVTATGPSGRASFDLGPVLGDRKRGTSPTAPLSVPSAAGDATLVLTYAEFEGEGAAATAGTVQGWVWFGSR
jgi:hypothetical protein